MTFRHYTRTFWSLAAVAMASLTFSTTSANADLVGHWEFDNSGDVGQATVNDDLTAVGDAAYSSSGKIGGALALDGTGDYLTGDSDLFSPAAILPTGDGSYTLAAFVQTTATASQGIIGWGNYGSSGQVNAFRTESSGTKILNYGWGGGNDYSATATGLIDGTWHHVAATYDSATSTKRLYFDGAEIGTGLVLGGDLAVGSANFRIGSTNSGEFMNGLIDDVRVYNSALSESEISTLSTGIPEPSSLALFGFGSLTMLMRRRRG